MKSRMYKKIISILVVFIMLINACPNFSLLNKVVYAEETKKGIIIKPAKSDFEVMTNGTDKLFTLNVYLKDINTATWAIQLYYPSDKVQPAKYTESIDEKTVEVSAEFSQAVKFTSTEYPENPYDSNNGFNSDANGDYIYFSGQTTSAGRFDVQGELLVVTINFKVMDPTLKLEDLANTFKMDNEITNINLPEAHPGDEELEGFLYGDTDSEYFTEEGFVAGKQATSISVDSQKTDYIVGDNFELGTVTLHYSDGTSKELTSSEYTVSLADGTQLNAAETGRTVTVTYNEDTSITTSFDINVIKDYVTEITINPTTATGKCGDTLAKLISDNNIQYTIKYASKKTKTGTLEESMVAGYNPNTTTTQNLTVTYVDENTEKEDATTTLTVTLTDEITGIKIKDKDNLKIEYKWGDTLSSNYKDTTNPVKVIVTYSSKDDTGAYRTEEVDISKCTIEGFESTNNEKIGQQQTVTVNYKGFTDTFNVVVKDYVTGIKLITKDMTVGANEASISAEGGKTLDELLSENEVKYIVTYAGAGDKEAQTLTSGIIEGSYDNTKIEEQTLKVKYTDSDANSATKDETFEATLKITTQDYITKIDVTAPTSTQTYNHGATIDLTGATITVTYASGATKTDRVPTANMVFEQGTTTPVNMSPASYDSTNKVTKTVTLTYSEGGKTGSVDFDITIINDIRKIEVTTLPKTDYNINETLDLTEGKVTVTRAVGSSEIDLSDCTVTGFNSSVENESLPLTVSYTENEITQTTTYDVTIKDKIIDFTINNAPTEVKYNEDLTGITLTVTKGSGVDSTPVTVTSEMISGYDKTTLGSQKVTITYEGISHDFNVVVKDYVTKITVTPDSIEGNCGDALADLISTKNVKYKVVYAKAGEQAEQALTTGMIQTVYNANSTEAQELTVKYTDTDANSATKDEPFEATLTVTLKDIVTGITVTAPTSTQTYNHGGTIDLTGATITVKHQVAEDKTVTPTASMVFEQGTTTPVNMSPASYDATNKVTKTVTLTYSEGGKTGSVDFDITIINDIRKIEVTTLPKTDYNINETLDLTGGKVTVTRAVGSSEIDLSECTVTGFNSSVENESLPLTVSYTENEITQTTTYDVTIKDKIIDFTINNAPTEVKYNEDLTGITLTVTKGSGVDSTPVTVTSEMISGYDKTTLGSQKVTITYEGISHDFNVVVKDYVTKIIVTPDSIEGNCGDALADLISTKNVKYKVVYAKAGEQAEQALTTGMIQTVYNANSTEAQELTVKYTDTDANSATKDDPFEAKLTVTLKDMLVDIEATNTKTEYFEGETLNKTKIEVIAKYQVANQKEVTNYVVKDKNGNVLNRALNKEDNKIIIEYTENGITKSKELALTVKEDSIIDITIKAPTKTEYKYSDGINLAGGSITKIWESGIAHAGDTIPMTKEMLSNSDITDFDSMKTIGTKQITVTYEGITKTNAFSIVIKDYMKSIEIQDESKLQKDYVFGDTINLKDKNPNASGTYDDLYIVVKYAGGTPDKTLPITSNMVSGFDMSKVQDNQKVTVSYTEDSVTCTDEYYINVRDGIVGIDVTKEPAKKVYKLNEVANFSDIVVKNVMKSGKEGTTLSATEYTISGFNSSSVGEKTIAVTKNGTTYTDTFKIKVIDATTDMYISTLPKTTYKYGEALDLTNGKITVKTQTNTTGREISMQDSSVKVTGYNANKLGEQTLTVTYTYKELNEKGIEETKTKTDTFTVKVEDYWDGKIEIIPPTKREYKYGEDLNLAGGKVGKIMASGAKMPKVDITGEMISGYDRTKVGKQTITVTYEGKKATFDVTVIDELLGISMNTLPNKIEYTQGEGIDVTGATINVTKTSGTSVVTVTNSMISGYNPNKTGTQVITVTYGGKTTQFVVNVKPAPVKPSPKPSPKPSQPTKPSPEPIQQVEKFTVRFIDYDGTILKEEVVEKGNSATAPELEKREGYKFTGWSRDFEVVESDMTIIAKYEEVIRAKIEGTAKNDDDGEPDLSDVILIIFDEGGDETGRIPVTMDMISGYDPDKTGTQVVTVTYIGEDGYKYTAKLKLKAKKPVETLGVKDETEEEFDYSKIILPIAGVGITGLLIFLIAWLTKKNVKIYALTEDERKLIGKEKITKKEKRIELDEYEKQLENANIEIVLNKKITKKLDDRTVAVVFKGQKATYKVVYEDDKEFSIKIKNV